MKANLYLFFVVFLFGSAILFSQEEPPTDDLGEVSDAFQEHFFEAIKQRAIENHELALVSLQKARDASNQQQKAVVYFEMGKNLTALKRYREAEDQFNRVLQLKGEKLDVLEALYDVYYEQKDYRSALPLVEKLSSIDQDYKEDLANLYSITGAYQKALSLLDELDDAWGESPERNQLRRRIYAETGDAQGAIGNLIRRIEENPGSEQDYLNLIFLYSEQGDKEKAFTTAKELLAKQPGSQMVHLALYKFYLDERDIQKAVGSIRIVLGSPEIDKEQKFRVLDDFISTAVKQPEYESVLKEILEGFGDQDGGQVNEKLGHYFLAKDDRKKAYEYFSKGLRQEPSNFDLIRNCLLLQVDLEAFREAESLSKEAMANFPAQPLLYLVNGLASNALGRYEQAIESLGIGLDFLFDNTGMQKDFYLQLSIAYKATGDNSRAEEYQRRANQITISN